MCRTYKEWGATSVSSVSPVRIILPADAIAAMISITLSAEDTNTLWDVSMVVLAPSHRLCSSYANNIERSSFELNECGWTALVTRLKGHTSDQARRYGPRRFVSRNVPGYPYSSRDVMAE